MEVKNVLLLVDNRHNQYALDNNPQEVHENDSRASSFKAIDLENVDQPKQTQTQQPSKFYDLQKRVQLLEDKLRKLSDSQEKKIIKKKNRRRALEINRNFKCFDQKCSKTYGSETSLKNHIKLKHSLKI